MSEDICASNITKKGKPEVEVEVNIMHFNGVVAHKL